MEWEKYKSKIKEALDIFKFNKDIISVLENSAKNNQRIFIAGNGGSASLANHYVCDLSKSTNWPNKSGKCHIISLSSNIAHITAISNDYDYKEIFKQQLINLASPNDILILISCSGNSQNIIKAAEYARERGLIIIGICGFDGGKLKKLCHYCAHIPIHQYEICEDIHSIFGHFLATHLRSTALKE